MLAVNDLLNSCERIQSTSEDASGLSATVEELQNALQLLEADLEDLDACVRVVEGHGERWGIDDVEVGKRRSFVNNISSKIQVGNASSLSEAKQQRLRSRVQQTAKSSQHRRSQPLARYRDEEEGGAPDDHEGERWEQEEQQVSYWCRSTLIADSHAQTGEHAWSDIWDVVYLGLSSWSHRQRGQ